RLMERLQSVPHVIDVNSDLQPNGLGAYIEIDRSTAARFGITPATVDNALYDAFGQRIISTIFTQTNQYRVILESDPKLQTDLGSLNSIYLPSSASSTGQVSLATIASVRQVAMPLAVNH